MDEFLKVGLKAIAIDVTVSSRGSLIYVAILLSKRN